MEEETKASKEFLKDFNWGYQVAKELGLKPDDINGMSASENRMQAIKDGVNQYQKDIELEKNKDIIPPFDMDSIDNSYIDLTPDKEGKDKGIDMGL